MDSAINGMIASTGELAMLQILIAAALVQSAPAPSKAMANIQAARAAVDEMRQVARTPEEKALAERDFVLVERAARLVIRRESSRAAYEASKSLSSDQLVNVTKQMQEAQMSFNLQYLQLQSQMQHENRSYTAISNIMKTKHDTVKNSISNVR
jgi:hypothetical protein